MIRSTLDIMTSFIADAARSPNLVKPLLCIAVLGLLLRIVWRSLYNVFFHPLTKVPGPRLARLTSLYMTPAQVKLETAQSLARLHHIYGPVVRVGPNKVSISDWRKYREIYGPKASIKTEDFYAAATFLGHENVFSMRNKAQHSARRKMQSQPYSQNAVFENEALIADKAQVLVRRIIHAAQESSSGMTADIYRFCGLFSLEVILKCAFNRDYGDAPDGSSSIMLKAMDASALLLPIDVTMPFLKNFGLGRHVPGFIGETFRQFDVWVDMTAALLSDFQQQEKALDPTHRFMATPLLLNDDEFLGRRLSQGEQVEEAMGIAFAGSGTTSTTLTYLIYALARNQDLQMKLRSELKGGGTTLGEIKDLPFLNAVIKETMRLYPTIISTLPRTLEVPIEAGGLLLPKGTEVGMQNYVHHRDPDVFPLPEQFLPERWLEATKDMRDALTPFSVGPRNCIGQNLARAELYLATSHIFRRLKLSVSSEMSDDNMVMEDRFNIAPKGRRLVVDVEVLTQD